MIKAVTFLFFLTTVTFAGDIPKLKISPTTDCELPNNQSIAYCPTAIFAWKKLEKLAGEPIKMENQDQLVDDLNNAKVPESVAPTNAHVAMAGFINEGVLEKLKSELEEKFGSRTPQLPDSFSNPLTVLISYSYLERSLPFVKKFRKFNVPLVFTNGNKSYQVQSFGVPKNLALDYSDTLKIISYENEDNFSLKMKSRINDEFLILTKVETPDKLQKEIEDLSQHLQKKVESYVEVNINGEKKSFKTSLFDKDLLVIPKVRLNKEIKFQQLIDKPLMNESFKGLSLTSAWQNIKFKMDEKGAYVRSDAGISYGGVPTPRKFIFDKPFLITMWKKDQKQPYLAVWVASPNILYKFKKK